MTFIIKFIIIIIIIIIIINFFIYLIQGILNNEHLVKRKEKAICNVHIN